MVGEGEKEVSQGGWNEAVAQFGVKIGKVSRLEVVFLIRVAAVTKSRGSFIAGVTF